MIKVEHLKVFNLEGAIRGMRNPYDSWSRSDSHEKITDELDREFIVGPNDLDLMKRLYKGGPEHRKYLRQIIVSGDIVAPLYLWKELDTYTVGVVKNSCSTMHTISDKKLETLSFSFDHCKGEDKFDMAKDVVTVVNICEKYRQKYLETGDVKYWRHLIQLLPESYNQRRTVTMNYENVVNIISQRKHHKLIEWQQLTDALMSLPLIRELMEDE